MARQLSDVLIDFVAALRAADVRISVAESLDAMQAVSIAGLVPARTREALRASLIKSEVDSPVFDRIFAAYFAAPQRLGQSRQGRDAHVGLSGEGRGEGTGLAPPPNRPTATPSSSQRSAVEKKPADPGAGAKRRAIAINQTSGSDRAGSPGEKSDPHQAPPATASPAEAQGPRPAAGDSERAAAEVPFADYTPLEYDQARAILGLLQRRLRVRLGRRMRQAKAGRIDLRRTLRASIQRGGALIDLKFRARRPRHIDLLILADISGSVRYASTLMLELTAGAAACFRRVRSFVFIDRLAAADFEQGHLVMTPNLDRYARSDFGRVLAELVKDHLALINPATVLLIMGDGRNNRRPARADLLRDLSRRCRATVWLNPEPTPRWGTGDSAIAGYAKVVDCMLSCINLNDLEKALAAIV